MTEKPDPQAEAAEPLRLERALKLEQDQATEAYRKAEHWRGIALANRQAENERRESLGIPPLPIPDELKGSAKT